ncbi:hypothetical protein [Fimbriiglobus ruber]|uniref:hypothetical protein n=1 Tax=Fimbriiglobus ruber TaxID=1908690 RepID=UPI000B4A850F|nr:hypothetical protein [Fimbriiglobus ruber]
MSRPAPDVAATYLRRRTIEVAFQELADGLRGEVDTLAYPKAALFAFGLAVAVYNLLQVVRRAAEHRAVGPGEPIPDPVSPVLLGHEVRSFAAGVATALDGNPDMPTPAWTVEQLRAWIRTLARRLTDGRYAKSKRGHRKARPKAPKAPKGSHTATARVLAQRRIKSQ